jgi:hypothetical protein
MPKSFLRLTAGLLAFTLAAEPALATPWRFTPVARPGLALTLFNQEALTGRSRETPHPGLNAFVSAEQAEQIHLAAMRIMGSNDRRKYHGQREQDIAERRVLAQVMRERLVVLEARRIQLERELSPLPLDRLPFKHFEWIQDGLDYIKQAQSTLRTTAAFTRSDVSLLVKEFHSLELFLIALKPIFSQNRVLDASKDALASQLVFRQVFGSPLQARIHQLDIRLVQVINSAGRVPVPVINPDVRSTREIIRVILFAGHDARRYADILRHEFTGRSATRYGKAMLELILIPEQIWPDLLETTKQDLRLQKPADLRDLTRKAFTLLQPNGMDEQTYEAYRSVLNTIVKLNAPDILGMARAASEPYPESDRRATRWEDGFEVLHPEWGIGIIRRPPPASSGPVRRVIGNVGVEFVGRGLVSLPYQQVKPVLSQWALPIAAGVDAELQNLVRKDKTFVPILSKGKGPWDTYFSWDTVRQVYDRYVPGYRDGKGAMNLTKFAKAFGRTQAWIRNELEAGRMEADQTVIIGPGLKTYYFAYILSDSERAKIQKLLDYANREGYGDLIISRKAGIKSRRTIWLIRTGKSGVSRLYAEKIRYALRSLRNEQAVRTVSIPDSQLKPLVKRLRAVIEGGISYDTLEDKTGYSRSGLFRMAYEGMGVERESADRIERGLAIVEPWLRPLPSRLPLNPIGVAILKQRLDELELSPGQWIPPALSAAILDLLKRVKRKTGMGNPQIGAAAGLDRDAVRRVLTQKNYQTDTARRFLFGLEKILKNRVRSAGPATLIALALAAEMFTLDSLVRGLYQLLNWTAVVVGLTWLVGRLVRTVAYLLYKFFPSLDVPPRARWSHVQKLAWFLFFSFLTLWNTPLSGHTLARSA